MDPITRQVALASAGAGGVVDVEDVFKVFSYSGGQSAVGTFPLDLTQDENLVWIKCRNIGTSHVLADTVRGPNKHLKTNSPAVEDTSPDYVTAFNTGGFSLGTDPDVNIIGRNYVYWLFKSAPKFFDIVTWTGDGSSSRTISHNLGTSPRLMITKGRDEIENWFAYSEPTGNGFVLRLSNTSAALTTNLWDNTTPTSSNFYISGSTLNTNTKKYIAYLFGDIPGVIKVGEYTGNPGVGVNVDCGFTNGAQFVMIKAKHSARNWYVFDTDRGINGSGGNDPNILWDTNSAETTTQNHLSPYSSGFRVDGTQFLGTNNSEDYLFMAIAAP